MDGCSCLDAGDIQLTETVPDALVVSSAVPERNVEIVFAKEAGACSTGFLCVVLVVASRVH
jgi:hypothetical protein